MHIKISALALALILSLFPLAGFPQCTKDTDCKGDRICEQGQFAGQRNEEGENGAHFYNFEDGQFVHLQTVPKK